MRFSLIVFGVAVITAPRGADCASTDLRERLIPEHAETSNTEEIKYLKSVWDTVESWRSWRYSETSALAELERYGVVHGLTTGNAENIIANAPDTPERIARWQTTLRVIRDIFRELNEVERGNSADRYKYRIGWNLAKPRWDEKAWERIIKRESFNGMKVELLKNSRAENAAAGSVVFEGRIIGDNRKVVVEYSSTSRAPIAPKVYDGKMDPLVWKFVVFEVLDRLNVKGVAPVPVGLSSPAIKPDYKVCRTDDRLVAGRCSLLPHSWMFRGLVTEPLLDETTKNVAKSVTKFLTDWFNKIRRMAEASSEQIRMKKQVFVDIIKIGGLVVDALEKLHDVGFLYKPESWHESIRVAQTSNGLAVQLLHGDFSVKSFYPHRYDVGLRVFMVPEFTESGPIGSSLAPLRGYRLLRRDDIYIAIQFVASMLGWTFNQPTGNILYKFLRFKKSETEKLYQFKKFVSFFLDVNNLSSTGVNWNLDVGSKRVVNNAYCQNFGLSSAKGSPCITVLEHLDEALLRVQFLEEEIDAPPDYENIKKSFADALIEANKLLVEE